MRGIKARARIPARQVRVIPGVPRWRSIPGILEIRERPAEAASRLEHDCALRASRVSYREARAREAHPRDAHDAEPASAAAQGTISSVAVAAHAPSGSAT
jgi:hypothetical protein